MLHALEHAIRPATRRVNPRVACQAIRANASRVHA